MFFIQRNLSGPTKSIGTEILWENKQDFGSNRFEIYRNRNSQKPNDHAKSIGTEMSRFEIYRNRNEIYRNRNLESSGHLKSIATELEFGSKLSHSWAFYL